mgnify:CR=1 FL=1
MEAPYTLEYLRETLRNNVVSLVFTKKNGEQRVMKCTLIPEKISATIRTDEENKPLTEISSVVVWDLEKNEWRSFKVERVTSVTIL